MEVWWDNHFLIHFQSKGLVYHPSETTTKKWVFRAVKGYQDFIRLRNVWSLKLGPTCIESTPSRCGGGFLSSSRTWSGEDVLWRCEGDRKKRSFSLHARVISTAFLWRVFPLKLGKEIANTWTFVRIFDQKELDDMEKQTGLHALDSGIFFFFPPFLGSWGLWNIVKTMLEKTYGNGTIYICIASSGWHLPGYYMYTLVEVTFQFNKYTMMILTIGTDFLGSLGAASIWDSRSWGCCALHLTKDIIFVLGHDPFCWKHGFGVNAARLAFLLCEIKTCLKPVEQRLGLKF